MTVDDLTRRAIIAAHDAGCDRQCGEDALTFRRLTSGEQAIVELWRADWERAERLVAWKDTGFRERDKWQERAEAAEAELARLRTATGMADELGARVTDERNEAQAAIERALAIWREHTGGSGQSQRCVCRACEMGRVLDRTEATDGTR